MNWQMDLPLDAVIFDCDGTLSTIEGIDELARNKGVFDQVQALTMQAMGETGINENIYQARLSLVKPSFQEVNALSEKYYLNATPDIEKVLAILQRLHKPIFILSAGLQTAVENFGKRLNISAANIFAVNTAFSADGAFIDFDHDSPLVRHDGKAVVVNEIKKTHPRIMYIGDGLNDLAVFDFVTRFVGYGGSFYYEKIAARCQFYIKTNTMTPLLPLGLTPSEQALLTSEEKIVYDKGLQAITENQVIIKNKIQQECDDGI